MSTLTSVNGRGVVGSRPGAGVAGQLYYATDVLGGTLQRDNGSTWDNLVSGQIAQISKTTLVGTAASITFSTIPATFSKLILDLTGRSDNASTTAKVTAQFNSDSGAHYDFNTLVNSATTVSGAEGGGGTSLEVGYVSGASASTGNASSIQIELPNYAGTTLHKVGTSNNALKLQDGTGNQQRHYALWWINTAAISNIVLTPVGNFIAGTVAVLYGVV